MNRCYWLVNHKITKEQKQELCQNFNISEILLPPENISNLWSSIPTTDIIPNYIIHRVKEWLSSMDSSDIAVVHGEPVIVFKIVNYLLDKDFVVLSSVSQRKVIETIEDGKVFKQSEFEHICFRKYEK